MDRYYIKYFTILLKCCPQLQGISKVTCVATLIDVENKPVTMPVMGAWPAPITSIVTVTVTVT